MFRGQYSTVLFIVFAFLRQSSPAAVGTTTMTETPDSAATATTTSQLNTVTPDDTTADVTSVTETTSSVTETGTVSVVENSTVTNESAVCEIDIEGCSVDMERHPTECRCICKHKSNPKNKERYFVSVSGHLWDMPCSPGTVWDQDKCTCGYPRAVEKTSQTKDLPSPEGKTSCVTLINYALDSRADKYTDGKNYVGLKNKVKPIEVVASDGAYVNERAANFTHNFIVSPVLLNNDLTHTAVFGVRFKSVPQKDNVTRVILSNGCPTSAGDVLPSVMLSYNAVEDTFYVAVKTIYRSTGVCENPKADQDGWYNVTISVDKSVTTVYVNDVKCLKLTGKGNIATTSCGLTIGGDPFRTDHKRDFNGYVDYVKVVKHCSTLNKHLDISTTDQTTK